MSEAGGKLVASIVKEEHIAKLRVARYPASRSFLISFSRMVEAIHLPPTRDPDSFVNPLFDGKERRAGVRARAEGSDLAEGEGVGKAEETLSLYRGGKCFLRRPPHLPGGTRSNPTRRD